MLTATLPPGTAAGPATVAAAARAIPGSRLADQVTTGDARFSSAGGRVSFALVFTPRRSGAFSAADPAKPNLRDLG